jgi:hypothetical protein
MTTTDELPETLRAVRTTPLCVLRLDVRPMVMLGRPPGAYRRVGVVYGGVFEGERLAGRVLDGGSDWQTVRDDGSTILDVRLNLETHDHALIGMTYRGVRSGPADVLARIDRGEVVEPATHYFRIAPMFETGTPHYDWLNHLIAVGIGQRRAEGPVYSIFEVL